jgi:hypothetical protein
MNWEQRLRDLVLAGGAVAAVACVDGSGAAGDSGADGNVDAGFSSWCNGGSDPCCPSLYCGLPVSPACAQKNADETACASAGGKWDDFAGCSYQDSEPVDVPSDAGTYPDVQDSGPSDAPSDAVTYPDVQDSGPADASPDSAT